MGNAPANNRMGFDFLESDAFEHDTAAARPEETRKGFQRGRFTGAVGAQQSNELAALDRERDASEGVDRLIVDVQVVNLEHVRPMNPDLNRLRSPAHLDALDPDVPRRFFRHSRGHGHNPRFP